MQSAGMMLILVLFFHYMYLDVCTLIRRHVCDCPELQFPFFQIISHMKLNEGNVDFLF